MLQYDDRGIGLGWGLTIGSPGYDQRQAGDKIYHPDDARRTISAQARLRLFNERYFFIETLGGYDAASLGEYNWQFLAGSRFNSDKYLLKAGVALHPGYDRTGYVLSGQLPLGENLYLSPSLIYYRDSEYNFMNGYRAVVGLEYRFYDSNRKK
jgi:hypothetical protein